MTYEKIFSEVKKQFSKADVKKLTADFAFQFNITGEGEGIFYAAYKNGVLSVEPYDYKDRDAVFTADGATFTAIASGKLDAMEAIGAGKLYVDGNYELAQQLLLLIPAKKTAAKKAPAKKPAAKKAAPVKKAPVKKAAPAVKAPEAKVTEAKAPAKKPAEKAPVKAAPVAETKPVPKKTEKK